MRPHNHPFDEVCKRANQYAKDGYEVYQKWTCVHCGERLMMEQKNTFYREGDCDKCGGRTNIAEEGCNYMLISKI